MPDIYAIGEVLVAFISKDVDSVERSKEFTLAIAGAEANVAVGATRLGLDVALQSQVGIDLLGTVVLNHLSAESVKVDLIKRIDRFTGTMVRNQGEINPIDVSYLRKGSAASEMQPDDINIEALLASKWLHVTGITCAISKSAQETVKTAMRLAKSGMVKTSFDLNIRKKLWSSEEARAALLPLMQEVDLLIGGVSEFEIVFSSQDPEINLQRAAELGISTAIMTDGPNLMRVAHAGERFNYTPITRATVDPVGSGDAFVAGLLSGLIGGLSLSLAVTQGSECGSLVASKVGDWTGLPYGIKGVMK
jgi:2-dehydro-3-deoxygluconokinase